MIIKSFKAETSAAALKMVRSEMGGDAIILKTRELIGKLGNNRIEITACLENPTVGQSNAIFPDATKQEAKKQDAKNRIDSKSEDNEEILTKLHELENRLADVLKNENRSIDIKTENKITEDTNLFDLLYEADVTPEFVEKFKNIINEKKTDSDNLNSTIRETMVEQLSHMMLPNMEFENGDKLMFIGPAGSGKSS
ncbi:MAG: hypothetical protein U9N54_09440, partial [candidate division Zixibacteria bacterium]|nr:hypothetical protein [candidate division Zixibacteria bacterium]